MYLYLYYLNNTNNTSLITSKKIIKTHLIIRK